MALPLAAIRESCYVLREKSGRVPKVIVAKPAALAVQDASPPKYLHASPYSWAPLITVTTTFATIAEEECPLVQKRTAVILSPLLLTVVVLAVWGADELVRVLVDGREQSFTPAARVRNGVTYAPLRASAEALGAKVEWNRKAQMAIVCAGNQCVPIKRSQGIIVDGSLLIPLRLMAQALKCDVKWYAPSRTVAIWTKEGDPRQKAGFTPPCEGACDLPSTR